MGQEIERKWLVDPQHYSQWCRSDCVLITQSYLPDSPNVRVRTIGNCALITIKGSTSEDGTTRSEFEYPIPYNDANEMLAMGSHVPIQKYRHSINVPINHFSNFGIARTNTVLTATIDVYVGMHSSLVIAEIEFNNEEDCMFFDSPPTWFGREVTDDPAFKNSALYGVPYKV